MATSRLKLYNDTLMICGERILASLTEDRKPRRLLDHVWDNDGVQACLEAGQWKFAMKAVRVDYDTSITPEFGYKRAFQKPTDWCATSAVCEDEYFNSPLLQYGDEQGYWYAELDEIYVKYVSNDANYGGDLAIWPAKFKDYVAAHFATKIILDLTSDEKKIEQVVQWEKKARLEALNHDSMSDPTKFPAEGGWNTSRRQRGSSRDRGSRTTLIG